MKSIEGKYVIFKRSKYVSALCALHTFLLFFSWFMLSSSSSFLLLHLLHFVVVVLFCSLLFIWYFFLYTRMRILFLVRSSSEFVCLMNVRSICVCVCVCLPLIWLCWCWPFYFHVLPCCFFFVSFSCSFRTYLSLFSFFCLVFPPLHIRVYGSFCSCHVHLVVLLNAIFFPFFSLYSYPLALFLSFSTIFSSVRFFFSVRSSHFISMRWTYTEKVLNNYECRFWACVESVW